MRKCGGRNVSPRKPPGKQFERVDILDAMAQATVPEDGDAIEKTTWAALAPFFPHYEEFWRIHLVPLRSTGGRCTHAAGSMTTFNSSPCSITLCMSLWEKPTNESWGPKRSRARVECRLLLGILRRRIFRPRLKLKPSPPRPTKASQMA